ncbi:MAG TPA: LytTR family DNA-binding domain-containing protein [Chryseosolibacter sp.]
MKVLILEDEMHSAERLASLIRKYDRTIDILAIVGSLEEAREWFANNLPPDLIFMDIHLSDGSSFELFKSVTIEVPIIFVTAYDRYAIQAFKVNSIDYLVKPVDEADLTQALVKFNKIRNSLSFSSIDITKLTQAITSARQPRLVAKINDQLVIVKTDEIAYCVIQNGNTWVYSNNGTKVLIDHTLEELEKQLNPNLFFRINRKFIVKLESIKKIESYFNSRYVLKLLPDIDEEVIVARDRAQQFKRWLEGEQSAG